MQVGFSIFPLLEIGIQIPLWSACAFERIDLVFINVDKNKSDIIVEFYNTDTGNLDLYGELQLAEKWCKMANDKIAAIGEIK